MARRYDQKDTSADEYEYYDDEYDAYDDLDDDEYDDYDDYEDDYEEYEVDVDEYYDDDDEYEDDDLAMAEYDDEDEEEYYFDEEEYDDRPSLGIRFLQRVSRPAQIFILSLIVVVSTIMMGWNYIDNRFFQPVDKANAETVKIDIKRRTSSSEIAKQLVDEGIIRDKNIFKLYVDINDKSNKIRAGIYELSPAMTIPEVVDVLSLGAYESNESKFTLVEGKGVDALLDVLKTQSIMADEAAYKDIVINGTGMDEYYFLKDILETEDETTQAEGEDTGEGEEDETESEPEIDDGIVPLDIKRMEGQRRYLLEGYLFPDTYIVYSDAQPADILRKMLNQFEKKFTSAYEKRAQRMGMTVDDVITLASIIQREGTENDFEKVSAVFHNRLRKGMPLQSCATAQYYLNISKLVLSEGEEQVDHPYNTYVYEGLPVGPICNPSAAAIKAALYPDEELMQKGQEYLYFCLMDPEAEEREQIFNKTLKEHNKAKEEWQPYWEAYDEKYAN